MVVEPITHVVFVQIQLTNAYNTIGIPLHREILDEIRAGNPVGARQAVRRLMHHTRRHTREALTAMEASKG
jgi:DNA-binding FadR family transcriptional regulator